MFIFLPCDSAHGKLPTERRGSIPLPFPGQILNSWKGIFLAQSPEKLLQHFYLLGTLYPPCSQTSAPGWGWQKSKNLLLPQLLCGRGIKLSDSISLSSQIRGEGTSIPRRKRGEFSAERQENLSPLLPGAPLPARSILRGKCYSFHNP